MPDEGCHQSLQATCAPTPGQRRHERSRWHRSCTSRLCVKAPTQITSGAEMTETKGHRPRVLRVDDYPDAREMYSEYLDFSGFDVIEAANGVEALQRAADDAPDIILMDLSLPVMDGWEATLRLKSDAVRPASPWSR